MLSSDRDHRVHRLTENARQRAAGSFASARRAIMSIQARGERVTTTSVAREAGLSVSYVSRNPELREQINTLKNSYHPGRRAVSETRSEASLRTQLDVAVDQLNKQATLIDQLKQENANLRGEVLRLGRRKTSNARTDR